MTREIDAWVRRIGLWDRHFITTDGRLFRLREVIRFESGSVGTQAWLEGGDRPVQIAEAISTLTRELNGLFVLAHRFHLVPVHRISAVFERYPETPVTVPAGRRLRAVEDECELELEGSTRRVPVTAKQARAVKKALGLRSLDHMLPEHPDDKRLRKLGITDFGWRELYALSQKDTAAVKAFKAAWEIVRFSPERMMVYFRQFGAPVIDKRRLAKCIVWQTWRWIRKGIRERFKGNIRSFWYEVKNALGGDEILDPDDVDMFYDVVRELIEDRRLFRYKDFGFMDMKQLFHGVGERRPEVVLAFEKAGQWEEARELAGEAGSSFICLGGEPSVLTMEYFADNLRVAIGEKPLEVYIMTDINPAGVSIRNSFLTGMARQGLPVGKTMVLWESRDVPDALLPGGKSRVVRYEVKGSKIIPVKPSRMSQVTKALRWFKDLGDPRLKTEQEYPGEKRVVTIWGIDSDTASKSLIRRRFLEGVAGGPGARPRPRRRTG